MPTRNINLTPEMDAEVAQRITSGDYANASEVVRAGLRALRREEEDQRKLEDLRQALIAGDESGYIDGEVVIQRVRQRIKDRAADRAKAHVA